MVRRVTAMRVGAAAFLCSAQFFVLTNFFLWVEGGFTHSVFHKPGVAGLIATYAMGLPFWGRTLAGDLLFSAVLFAAYELFVKRPATAHSSAPA
jgi:hypothetical protein